MSNPTQTRVLVATTVVMAIGIIWLLSSGGSQQTVYVTVPAPATPAVASGDAQPQPQPAPQLAGRVGGASRAPAGKHISRTDLDPWQGEGVCCRTLRAAAAAWPGFPSDIQQLLPILAAYQREADARTVVELGSRLGGSTITMLKTMA